MKENIHTGFNKSSSIGCGLRKCSRCYWFDNCPVKDMTDEEIEEMIIEGRRVDLSEFACWDNVKHYFINYCRYHTPFDEDELAEIEYERNLKERADAYQEIIDELNDDEMEDY